MAQESPKTHETPQEANGRDSAPSGRSAWRCPDAILLDKTLSANARSLYGLIASVPRHDPTLRQILDHLGLSKQKPIAARKEL